MSIVGRGYANIFDAYKTISGDGLLAFILLLLTHFLYVFVLVFFPIVGLIINSIFLIDVFYYSSKAEPGSVSSILYLPLRFFIFVEIILLFIVFYSFLWKKS